MINRFSKWSITSAAVILLSLLSYNFADIKVALWFHSMSRSWYHDLFTIITTFGESQWYLAGGLLLFVVFRKKKPFIAYSGWFLFLSVAISGVAADIIKYIAGRARPKLLFSERLYGFDFFHSEHAWTSFPSGHSATAFSMAVVFAILYPRYRFFFYCFGALIAFSRVFLTEHYISDIIAGSFLGIVSTVLLYNHYFRSKLLCR